MAILLDPVTQRDFSAGRIAKSAVATALMTNYSSHSLTSAVNSVALSENVDYSEIIGSGIVRKGKTTIANFTQNQKDGETERVTNSGDELRVHNVTLQAQTFTPTSSEVVTLGIAVRLYFTGSIVGLVVPPFVTVSLQTTSGGNPTGTVVNGNIWSFVPTVLSTSYPGATIVFPTSPNTLLTPGTKYAIVIEFGNGDSSDYVEWIRNASTSYAGGQSLTSTNSGGSWSSNTGAFYFSQQIPNPLSVYNLYPLGNYSFLSNGLKKNVVAFQLNSQGFGAGVIYYYNVTAGAWLVSELFNLSQTAPIRFANMNGYVFEANGVQQMMSSADFGDTWGIDSCINSFDLRYVTNWNSGQTYAVGNVVLSGSIYYISIQDGSNEIPVSSPTFWTALPAPLIPSLLIVANNRMLAGGINLYPSRIYLSDTANLEASPTSAFLDWELDSGGNFIDVDPDANGILTAFANTSTMTLVFKEQALYRLNTISTGVSADLIYPVGAVSQEAVTSCLGLVYFYSGNGIYSTDGTFPQLLSRIAVQDFINAIPNPQQVYASTDGFNVYFSIGTVTITFGPNDQRTFNNVVLKFSPRDQNWQILTYQQEIGPMSQFGVIPLDTILATQFDGSLSTMNSVNFSDDGAAIPYFIETQEQEFGDRSHTKNISDKIVVYTRYGGAGSFLVKQNDGDFKSANMTLNRRINVGTDVNSEAQFFTFKMQGAALGSRPIWEGFHLPKVTDLGITQNDNAPN